MLSSEPRLKTEIRISAHIRRAEGAGAFATIARRGDPDAGAVAVKVYLGSGKAKLFIQSRDFDGRLLWREAFEDDLSEERIDGWIAKEASIDPDLWVIEIEDRDGRAFLE